MERMGLVQRALSRTKNTRSTLIITSFIQPKQETLLRIHNFQYIHLGDQVHMLRLQSRLGQLQEEEEEVLFGRVP